MYYRTLENFFDLERKAVPFAVKGLLSGNVKALFDGEQYLISDHEYKLKKKLFNDQINI
jgi:hypothetical protein